MEDLKQTGRIVLRDAQLHYEPHFLGSDAADRLFKHLLTQVNMEGRHHPYLRKNLSATTSDRPFWRAGEILHVFRNPNAPHGLHP